MENTKSHIQPVVVALTKSYIDEGQNENSFYNENLFSQIDKVTVDASTSTAGAKGVSLKKRQGFRISEINLMVAYEDGSMITELPVTYPIPNAPEWYVGFASLQGIIVPVFDIHSYLDVELKNEHDFLSAKSTKMLFVVQHGDNATGLIIHKLLERVEYTNESKQDSTVAPASLSDCISASYLIDDILWHDLDVDRFLDKLEKSIIKIS